MAMRMKDSGIEWIGEIPEDWELIQLKYLLQPGNRGIKIGPFGSSLKLDDTDENGVFKVYGQENLIKNNFLAGKRFIDETKYRELEGYTVFPGDILISMMGTIGKCNVVPKGIQQGIMDSHLTRIRVDEECIFNEYLELLIADSDYIKVQFDLQSKGSIMNGLNSGIIKELLVAKPSMDIQHSIVNFIKNRCAEIDAVIAAKQRQNELLKEQRQSIVYEAVTKGLDPTVTYKDSGVDWIGEIPAGWEVRKIKYVARMKSGESITATLIDEQGKYPVYGGNGLRGFAENFTHDGRYILIGRQGALCGNVHLVEGKFWASEHAVVVDVFEEYLVDWFDNVLQAMNLNQYSESAAQPGISVDRVLNLSAPVPPKKIQETMVAFLNAKCAELDRVVAANNAVIDKLKEYRQSLIYEAVTGKIAV